MSRGRARSRKKIGIGEELARIAGGYRALILTVAAFVPAVVAVYLLANAYTPLTQILCLSRSTPWGIITSLFLHVENEHLLSNLEALAGVCILFCAVICVYPSKPRSRWSRVFSSLFFVSGAGANAVEYLLLVSGRNVRSWGSSGMVYGIMGVLLAAAVTSLPMQIRRILKRRATPSRKAGVLIDLVERCMSAISIIILIFILWVFFSDTGGFFGEGPNVDTTAHMLGFLIGLMGGCAFGISEKLYEPASSAHANLR